MATACNTISKRICQEGHANALALNKDCTQIAVAGRSRTFVGPFRIHCTLLLIQYTRFPYFFPR